MSHSSLSTLQHRINTQQAKIAIIGLGYVGLPLAVAFGKSFSTVGFDISEKRVEELASGKDKTLEVSSSDLQEASHLVFSSQASKLRDCDVFIITVPTPIDDNKNPDLSPLIGASQLVGSQMQKGALVTYESTVYPGCTVGDCVPVLEKESGLKLNDGFFCGYSPERVNPGDKVHTLKTIVKVTSGSTPEAGEVVDSLYKTVVDAGTHLVSSIEVAEAAKVIENSQRDINIAFVNELSMIFHRMGLDTREILDAAGTKWNFLRFSPGLVGGHCIGVDPYYLTQRAKRIGYHPEIILAGRRLNDNMGREVAQRIVKAMIQRDMRVRGTEVLILGVTFKENCPDIRNSKVIDVIEELQDFGIKVCVADPWAHAEDVKNEYGLTLCKHPEEKLKELKVALIAVGHSVFLEYDFEGFRNKGGFLFDLKAIFPKEDSDGRL